MTRTSSDILDEWLVIRCQAGEVDAVRDLVARWHARLYAHARRLVDRTDAADDAMQESWLAIVRGIRRLDDPARFGPWAYAIVTYKCRDWIRKRRREPDAGATLEDAVAPPAVRSDIDRPVDDQNALRGALGALSPDHRAALALHYLEGMSVADIATSLGVPVGTIKSRLHHARERLRAQLQLIERTSA